VANFGKGCGVAAESVRRKNAQKFDWECECAVSDDTRALQYCTEEELNESYIVGAADVKTASPWNLGDRVIRLGLCVLSSGTGTVSTPPNIQVQLQLWCVVPAVCSGSVQRFAVFHFLPSRLP
jgi:hypothetical protein